MEIARGAQYKVIDIGNGRVKKIPLTKAESQAVIQSWYAPWPAPAEEPLTDHRLVVLESCQKIQELLVAHPQISASLGNPIFEADGVYTQDKVVVLGSVLQQCSEPQAMHLIKTYAQLITFHWQYGFSERVYNFTVNNGVKNNQVILLDFGEITFNKQRVAHAIANQRWLRSYSFKENLAPALQGYYAELIHSRLTLQTLDDTWNVAVRNG